MSEFWWRGDKLTFGELETYIGKRVAYYYSYANNPEDIGTIISADSERLYIAFDFMTKGKDKKKGTPVSYQARLQLIPPGKEATIKTVRGNQVLALLEKGGE